jgi:hypothetical protein
MKITKKILKQMIKEELGDLTPELELSPDVERVKDAMSNKIDNKEEFTQLLTLVLKMADEVTGAEEILRQALKQLPEFIAQMDDQNET